MSELKTEEKLLVPAADDCPHRVALLAHLDSHPGAKA